MKFDKIIKEIESIIKEVKDNELKDIKLNFCEGLRTIYDYDTKQERRKLDEKDAIVKYDNLKFMNLLITALKAEVDLEEFSQEVDLAYGTKSHQIFIISKDNYKKNTIVLTCNKENCATCFSMFTCPNNNKVNLLLGIEVQPSYVKFELKNNDSLGSKNQASDYVQRFKQNDHLTVLFGKMLYKLISENYKIKGFKHKTSR